MVDQLQILVTFLKIFLDICGGLKLVDKPLEGWSTTEMWLPRK